MNLNLTPQLILGSLYLLCFIISYWIMRYGIYNGEIKIMEHGTIKYVASMIAVFIMALIMMIVILYGLKLAGSGALITNLKCLG